MLDASHGFTGLYAIVDMPHSHNLTVAEVTAAVLPQDGSAGASVVQLRAKSATTAERVAMLETMAPMCAAAGVALVVNDDLDAALAAPKGVTGVHLGQEDLAGHHLGLADIRKTARAHGRSSFSIGVSTHNIAQLRDALKSQPDYIALGPIAPTRSKTNPDPVVGFRGLLEACRLCAKPVVAIGGLDITTGAEAIRLGVSSVAVIGALTRKTVVETRTAVHEFAIALRRAAVPVRLEKVAEAVPVLAIEQLHELALWADDIGTLITMGLPARFRPQVIGDTVCYRPQDIVDLLYVLDKRPSETWQAWRTRAGDSNNASQLVQLRGRP